ncbi:MAG: aminoacyl-tRNA hydrolase [Candidatus Woesebacteria bacterium]|nr:MAG: aminoacyl-tRNA hydrolase [Candidatus Woesebacteria bacterium]
MKVIVGLGNPGEKYSKTRHNVGFMVLDALADGGKFGFQKKFNCLILQSGDVILVKPQTFMNASGEAVSKLVDFYKVDLNDLWVIHDDLDLSLGETKIQKGVGPKLHNGIYSIEESLNSKEFWRVRVGVDNRDNNRTLGEQYVLEEFKEDEIGKINDVIKKIIDDKRFFPHI